MFEFPGLGPVISRREVSVSAVFTAHCVRRAHNWRPWQVIKSGSARLSSYLIMLLEYVLFTFVDLDAGTTESQALASLYPPPLFISAAPTSLYYLVN